MKKQSQVSKAGVLFITALTMIASLSSVAQASEPSPIECQAYVQSKDPINWGKEYQEARDRRSDRYVGLAFWGALATVVDGTALVAAPFTGGVSLILAALPALLVTSNAVDQYKDLQTASTEMKCLNILTRNQPVTGPAVSMNYQKNPANTMVADAAAKNEPVGAVLR